MSIKLGHVMLNKLGLLAYIILGHVLHIKFGPCELNSVHNLLNSGLYFINIFGPNDIVINSDT